MEDAARGGSKRGLSDAELAAERAVALPDREALSVVDPHAGGALVRPYPPFVHHPPSLVDPPPIYIDPVDPGEPR